MSQFYRPYDETHPVARSIANGSRWFDAWHAQYGRSYDQLAKQSGIVVQRLHGLSGGQPVSCDEIIALASVWGVQREDVIASIPSPHMLVADVEPI